MRARDPAHVDDRASACVRDRESRGGERSERIKNHRHHYDHRYPDDRLDDPDASCVSTLDKEGDDRSRNRNR